MVKIVKADVRYKLLPIVMLSSEGSKELLGQAQFAGAAGWIVKPHKTHQIVGAIKRLTSGVRNQNVAQSHARQV